MLERATTKLASRAIAAGVIRLFGMALSLLFLLDVARATSATDFGTFSLMMSLATICGYAACLGQHIAILRFWPAIDDSEGSPAADRLLAVSFTVVLIGSLVAASVISALPGALLWTGILAALFVLAEFAVSALRAKGHIYFALIPRDIVWRVLVILVVFSWASPMSADLVLLIASVILALSIAPQFYLLVRDTIASRAGAQFEAMKQQLLRASPALWLSSSANPIIEYSTTVIVGLVCGAIEAGIYFAADRLARVLGTGVVIAEQAIAPELSRAWHRGEKRETRRILGLASLFAFVIAAIGGLACLVFGQWFLGLFGPEFAIHQPILVILAAGQVFSAFCGANTLVLNIAGEERILLFIRLVWGALALGLTLLGAWLGGMLGAALMNALVVIGWNLSANLACRAKLNLGTTFQFMSR